MNNIIIKFGMLLILIGIFAVAINTLSQTWQKRSNKKPLIHIPAIIPSGLIILGIAGIILGNSFILVPTGCTGIKTTFGEMNDTTCSTGINFITPFVQKIHLVNNKQQTARFTDQIAAETNERTKLYVGNINVAYQIPEDSSVWVYTNVDAWSWNIISGDTVSSVVKSAARTLPNDTVMDRNIIEPLAKDLLQTAIDEMYGENRVKIYAVNIGYMEFDEVYTKAEAKTTAALQDQKEQAIRNQTAKDAAVAEAEVEREKARGEADAEYIRAEGKAKAAEKIASSVNDATQRQDALDKWDGTLPMAVSDNVSFGILDIADDSNNKTKDPLSTVVNSMP